jgi:putative spermidine/putrescine transport system permease protein
LRQPGLRTALMLTPALAVIFLFFGGGLLIGFGQSIDYMPIIGLRTPTLRHYVDILSDQTFYVSLGMTLYIALVSTFLATVLALAAAMVLRRSFRGNQIVTTLYQVPLPVPHLIAAAGIVMLLTQSGILARIAFALGVIGQPADFPALVFDRNNVGTILVYTWKEVPFIGLVVLAVLKGVGVEYEEVAQTLGANSWQRFRYVLLPLVMPGIVSTSIIVFAFLFGSFEIPLLLGVRYPNTLPVTAYRAYIDPDLTRRPEAMAMGVVITVIVVALLAIYRQSMKRFG